MISPPELLARTDWVESVVTVDPMGVTLLVPSNPNRIAIAFSPISAPAVRVTTVSDASQEMGWNLLTNGNLEITPHNFPGMAQRDWYANGTGGAGDVWIGELLYYQSRS